MARFNKIIVIGLGGTGSFLVPALSRYLQSKKYQGILTLVDGDTYSNSNIDRQLFDSKRINYNKAKYQAEKIVEELPDFERYITYCDEYMSQDDVNYIVDEQTLVINCADNKAIRKYVEDRVRSLKTACHICAGNEYRNGQVQISLKINDKEITPTIYKQSPNFNDTSDDRSQMSCDEISQIPGGGQIIAANMMAASIIMNYIVQLFSTKNPVNMDGKYIPAAYTGFDVLLNAFENRDVKSHPEL